jgi:hypothetical protein
LDNAKHLFLRQNTTEESCGNECLPLPLPLPAATS